MRFSRRSRLPSPSCGQQLAPGQPDPGDPARGAGQLLDGDAEPQPDPALGVGARQQRAGHVAELRAERRAAHAGERDVQAEGAGGGRDLRAEHAVAHDHQPPPGGQVAAQRERVVQRAQHVHAGQPVLAREPARGQPGGDDQGVGAQHAAGGGGDLPGRRVQRDGRVAERELRPQRVQPRLVTELDALRLPHPGQDLLRQRRPVVGQVRAGVEQRQAALVAVPPQRLGRAQAGRRGADDQHAAGRGHERPPRERVRMVVLPSGRHITLHM